MSEPRREVYGDAGQAIRDAIARRDLIKPYARPGDPMDGRWTGDLLMMDFRKVMLRTLIVVAPLTGCATAAHAQTMQQFYPGNMGRYYSVTPSGPSTLYPSLGGGYTLWQPDDRTYVVPSTQLPRNGGHWPHIRFRDDND